jgi:hypothetical protein
LTSLAHKIVASNFTAGVAAALVVFSLWTVNTLLWPAFLLSHFDVLLAVALAFWPFMFYFNLFTSDIPRLSSDYAIIFTICVLMNGILYLSIVPVGQRHSTYKKTAVKITIIAAYWGMLFIFIAIA